MGVNPGVLRLGLGVPVVGITVPIRVDGTTVGIHHGAFRRAGAAVAEVVDSIFVGVHRSQQGRVMGHHAMGRSGGQFATEFSEANADAEEAGSQGVTGQDTGAFAAAVHMVGQAEPSAHPKAGAHPRRDVHADADLGGNGQAPLAGQGAVADFTFVGVVAAQNGGVAIVVSGFVAIAQGAIGPQVVPASHVVLQVLLHQVVHMGDAHAHEWLEATGHSGIPGAGPLGLFTPQGVVDHHRGTLNFRAQSMQRTVIGHDMTTGALKFDFPGAVPAGLDGHGLTVARVAEVVGTDVLGAFRLQRHGASLPPGVQGGRGGLALAPRAEGEENHHPKERHQRAE